MIGVRALYRVDLFRAAVAAVLMPVVMLFFFALSMGASFNKMIVRLYPETQPQVTRFNDMSAFLYTSSVASAARQYKNELGFYPAHMGLLKKYLPSSASEELGRTDAANGYRYRYERLGEDRFVVASSPIQKDVSGHFVFFADETGQVRLGNQTGPVVKDIEALDQWTSSSR
jgi:glucan phosphoethanolaminetransferase (alkaline phosphatase superfamily)